MVTAAENREILFGVLAAKNNMISIEQVHEALGHWLSEDSASLSEILTEQGLLTIEQRQLIDSQVEQQLSQLTKNEETRSMLSDGASLTPTRTVGLSDDDSLVLQETVGQPSTTDRFRILRPHARGGLGEVFVARDEELDREVALKQIRNEYANQAEQRDRFLREAEITGKLEHPGIVPVYGLGQDAEGHPYYVMRFIRGESLRDAIRQFHQDSSSRKIEADQRNKELRRLLGWFNDVCDAIAYAHSRGVLHRDLKPANIMLGRFGETLVVDWGLARTLDTDSPATDPNEEVPVRTQLGHESSKTVIGTAVGTPAYMSPEQASGRLDLLGPRSDVYSLGATLYSILTGKTPVDGSHAGEVLGQVSRGEFEPPGSVATGIDQPLEAVCLKAMSLKPEDRYETPLELAADIEAWMADAPVTAWDEPVSVRARRWVKNHQTLVAGVAATIVVALLGSLVSSALLSKKNLELVEAKSLAEDNAETANEQSELALNTMTQVIRDFQGVFATQSSLSTRGNTMDREELVAERLAARRKMLQGALNGMRKVSDNLKNHSDYDDALVVAHMDLGDLFMEIGGEDFTDAREDAHNEFQSAKAICEKWIAAQPDDYQAKTRYGQALGRLSTHALTVDNADEAIRLTEITIRNSEELVDQQPENEKGYHLLLNNYFAMGTYQYRLRYDMEQAVAWNQKAVDFVDSCLARGFDFLDDYERNHLIPEIKNRILIFSSVPKIRQDVEFAKTLPRDLEARAMYDCAAWLIVDGEHENAFKILQKMETMDNVSGQDFYQNACGYAKCAKAVLKGREVSELSAEQAALVENYKQMAVATLYRSKAGGFFADARVVGLVGRDSDMDGLRDRDDFKKFIAEIRDALKPKSDPPD